MHSENMVKHNFYAHVDHLGQNPIQRAEKYNVKAWVRKEINLPASPKISLKPLGLKM